MSTDGPAWSTTEPAPSDSSELLRAMFREAAPALRPLPFHLERYSSLAKGRESPATLEPPASPSPWERFDGWRRVLCGAVAAVAAAALPLPPDSCQRREALAGSSGLP